MFGRKCKADLEQIKRGSKILREVNEELKVKLLDTRIEGDRLRAEIAALSDNIKLLQEIEPAKYITIEAANWIEGEPREQGWYFVAWKPMPLADTKTTALFYNPAARCKWMRGEKGNAERFEQEVIAYIEAPEYE
jgi:hypothetical protein